LSNEWKSFACRRIESELHFAEAYQGVWQAKGYFPSSWLSVYLRCPNQILIHGDIVASNRARWDTGGRVGQERFWIFSLRAGEDYPYSGIIVGYVLDNVLQKHSSLPVADLVRFIDDDEINSRTCLKCRKEKVQTLLSEHEEIRAIRLKKSGERDRRYSDMSQGLFLSQASKVGFRLDE
jgi:hypothetical protein